MGLIFYQNFVFLLFDDSNKSEGIFEFVPFLDGGPFLHGYGGGQFFGQIYIFFFLMIQANLKEFLSFDHFWMGRPFFMGGEGSIFWSKMFFSSLLMIQTNLKEFLSFYHFWMGGPFLQGEGVVGSILLSIFFSISVGFLVNFVILLFEDLNKSERFFDI